MRALTLALALFAGAVHAQAEPRMAVDGVVADALTTWAGLGAGAAELNPLGYATVPLRIGVVIYARKLPREEGLPIIHGITAVSWGAAASNLGVVLGAGTAAPVVALMVGVGIWHAGADEREFWRQCAEFRIGHPERTCNYTKQ